VTALTDTSGAAVERYVYDPYGKTTIYNPTWTAEVTWANSEQNEILYCGYRFDSETGLYHVRNRMYHTTLGRWMQRDPKGYVNGMGLYEYVASDPASHCDALGLEKKKPEEWRLDKGHHGDNPKNPGEKPHITRTVKGNEYRYNPDTLEPITHKGVTPPKLNPNDVKGLLSSGTGQKIAKQAESKAVKQAIKDLEGQIGKEATERLIKQGGRSFAKELAPLVTKRLPVVAIVFAVVSFAEGVASAEEGSSLADKVLAGGKEAARDAVSADVVESVAKSIEAAGKEVLDDMASTAEKRMRASGAPEDAIRVMKKQGTLPQ
jgi:RHS repeat-associated protein